MKIGRKHYNIKKIGRKIGKKVNVFARKALHTVERVAKDPYLGLALDAYAPGSSQGLREIGDGAHQLNKARGTIVNFANGKHEEPPRNELLN
jgi:hypothetical protein